MIAGFGRTLAELTSSEGRLQTQLSATNAEARRQESVFGGVSASLHRWLGVLAGAATIGAGAKAVFDYSEELVSTQNAIAGLLFANNKYTDSLGHVVDEETAWQAANGESAALMVQLQRESLKTAATVPQIADAFALVYGALNEAGVAVEKSTVVQLTTRLTQTANAMKVPMEQIRQEISSLITGQVTQDSTIAKRLGLDNAAIKQMQANGTLVEEIMRRTAGYAKAAEAQSNTFTGKLVNTIEIVTATFARAFGPTLEKSKSALDAVFQFFEANGPRIVSFIQRVALGVENVTTAIGGWIREHRSLVEEILSIGAVVGVAVAAVGVLGAAIAALTSPITLTIAAIVGLALVWEKARKYSEIEVGGRPIAAYMRATMAIVSTSWLQSLTAQVKALQTLYYATKMTFGVIAEVMLAPLRYVVAQINNVLQAIPASIARLIPNFDQIRTAAASIEQSLADAFKPVDNAHKVVETIADAAGLLGDLQKTAIGKATAALDSKGPLGGVADLVKSGWTSAANWLSGELPALTALGKQAAAALGLTSTSTVSAPAASADPAAASRARKAAEQLQKEKEEYFQFVEQYRKEATAAGDPLAPAFAKIEAERAIALAKLSAQREQLGGAISLPTFTAHEEIVNSAFDSRLAEARRKAIEGVKNDLIASLRLQSELTVSAQRETEDRRIGLIRNGIARELAERLAANRRWFEDESKKVEQSIGNEVERANQIASLAEERKRRDERDTAEADRRMREATFGYAEYWKKLSERISEQWRGIGQVIADTIIESRNLLGEAVNSFLNDLATGQGNLLKSLSGLSKGLTSLWTKALTEILMSGKNVAGQLRDLFRSIHVKNDDGSTDYLGTALQGGGFGGAVGGLFQTPNNYAGVGGSIGGAIGAVIGTYFGATGIGAAIGSAIGTAVGSMIQKGKDSIRVAIVDGVVSVTEHGISASARVEVATQVQRKVKEEMKSWQSLLDLFPQSIRDHLAQLQSDGKLAKPTLNLSGGVESADLTDEGALGALSDFLSNDLPQAAFNAYSNSIRAALMQLGAGGTRINELFTYWGTLQGKELHDAVERYVRVTLDTADIRDKINAPFEDKLRIAQSYGQTKPLQQLDDISAAIEAAVDRMAGLTDIEDIVAAQEQVNQLSHQYYEAQLQYLARINQIQQSITNSIAQQREQIELAGKDNQGKVDFFFQRMTALRGQLEAATDPEEINRLTQQIQQYVSQAFAIAPDNAKMRENLLGILGDIEGLANGRLANARQEVEARDEKPATALARASELLLQAAGDLADAVRPPAGTVPVPDDGRGPIDHPDKDNQKSGAAQGDDLSQRVMTELVQRMNDLAAVRDEIAAQRARAEELLTALRNAQPEQKPAVNPSAEDYAKAVRDALRGLELTAVDQIVVDNGDLGERVVSTAERRVIARIKDDPYLIVPRAA
ncbi:MAG TPA: hypothetical protein VF824_01920 [Thermoanaerobaculia bacterium]